jgi:hypothetical protein
VGETSGPTPNGFESFDGDWRPTVLEAGDGDSATCRFGFQGPERRSTIDRNRTVV